MADTRRTTSVVQRWRLGYAGEPYQLKASAQVCQDARKYTLTLPTNGREVFLPPLDEHRVYEVAVHRTCTYWEEVGLFFRRTETVHADALYKTDGLGNFVEPHEWLRLGGSSINRFLKSNVAEVMPQEDRETHTYTFRIDGSVQKIPASFCIQTKWFINSIQGVLTLTVELLPEGTPSPLAARRIARVAKEKARIAREAAEEQARLERKAAEESAKRAAQAAREKNALNAKLESLRLRVHQESHFLDTGFQQQYAGHYMNAIMTDLKQTWACEYDKFMRDSELKQLVQQEAPQVLEWLEARVKIVQLAERIMVAPAPPSPRRKMTADEVRARIIRRQGVRVDDGIALTKLKAEKIAEAKAMLDSLGLDPEERERLETELIQDILEAGEDENNGQGGTTL